MRITKSLKEKLEGIFKSIEFSIRYEKGNFKSGYCVLEEKNVIVINKFYPLESKVNVLVEILREIEVDETMLEKPQLKLYQQILQTEIQF